MVMIASVPDLCILFYSVACFGVRVSVTFHPMFVHNTFSSVWVAEWPPFGKELPTRLAVCSHCVLSKFPVLVLTAGFGFLLCSN